MASGLRMTFEQRLEQVAEMMRMIATQTVETVRLQKAQAKAQAENWKLAKQIQLAQKKSAIEVQDLKQSLKSLERIAVAHEKRLNSHEARLRKPPKPKR
jgi:hypothetical protein